MKIGTFCALAIAIFFIGLIGIPMLSTYMACWPLWPTCHGDPANGLILIDGLLAGIGIALLSNKIRP